MPPTLTDAKVVCKPTNTNAKVVCKSTNKLKCILKKKRNILEHKMKINYLWEGLATIREYLQTRDNHQYITIHLEETIFDLTNKHTTENQIQPKLADENSIELELIIKTLENENNGLGKDLDKLYERPEALFVVAYISHNDKNMRRVIEKYAGNPSKLLTPKEVKTRIVSSANNKIFNDQMHETFPNFNFSLIIKNNGEIRVTCNDTTDINNLADKLNDKEKIILDRMNENNNLGKTIEYILEILNINNCTVSELEKRILAKENEMELLWKRILKIMVLETEYNCTLVCTPMNHEDYLNELCEIFEEGSMKLKKEIRQKLSIPNEIHYKVDIYDAFEDMDIKELPDFATTQQLKDIEDRKMTQKEWDQLTECVYAQPYLYAMKINDRGECSPYLDLSLASEVENKTEFINKLKQKRHLKDLFFLIQAEVDAQKRDNHTKLESPNMAVIYYLKKRWPRLRLLTFEEINSTLKDELKVQNKENVDMRIFQENIRNKYHNDIRERNAIIWQINNLTNLPYDLISTIITTIITLDSELLTEKQRGYAKTINAKEIRELLQKFQKDILFDQIGNITATSTTPETKNKNQNEYDNKMCTIFDKLDSIIKKFEYDETQNQTSAPLSDEESYECDTEEYEFYIDNDTAEYLKQKGQNPELIKTILWNGFSKKQGQWAIDGSYNSITHILENTQQNGFKQKTKEINNALHFLQNHGLIIGHHGNKNERPVLSINMNSAHGVKCDPNLKHMQLIFKRAVFDFRRQHTRNGVF